MATLNGLTRPWDSFIQTMCARKESMKFGIVWEDCIQEEARVANREALPKEDDQALATHTNRGRSQSNFKKEGHKESQVLNLPRSSKGQEVTIQEETTPTFNVSIVTS